MTVRRIFIVDDDDAVRTSLIHLLSILPDSEVYGFASGDAFLEAVEDMEGGCLLLDLLVRHRQGEFPEMPDTIGSGLVLVHLPVDLEKTCYLAHGHS